MKTSLSKILFLTFILIIFLHSTLKSQIWIYLSGDYSSNCSLKTQNITQNTGQIYSVGGGLYFPSGYIVVGNLEYQKISGKLDILPTEINRNLLKMTVGPAWISNKGVLKFSLSALCGVSSCLEDPIDTTIIYPEIAIKGGIGVNLGQNQRLYFELLYHPLTQKFYLYDESNKVIGNFKLNPYLSFGLKLMFYNK